MRFNSEKLFRYSETILAAIVFAVVVSLFVIFYRDYRPDEPSKETNNASRK